MMASVALVLLVAAPAAQAGSDEWTVSTIAGDGNVTALAVGLSSGIVYAGTMGSVIGGLYASTDGGTSWHAVLHRDVSVVAVDSANENVVYTSGRSGTFRSDDGGATFVQLPRGAEGS